jgi:hypothetical protein
VPLRRIRAGHELTALSTEQKQRPAASLRRIELAVGIGRAEQRPAAPLHRIELTERSEETTAPSTEQKQRPVAYLRRIELAVGTEQSRETGSASTPHRAQS